MRKMLNKKGFSLVELMIVVVIMGILIAVAIPLYGNITKNSKNKTCASNIDTIENAAAVYMTENGKAPTALTDLTFEGGTPVCPWDESKTPGYTIAAPSEEEAAKGMIVKVTCASTAKHEK